MDGPARQHVEIVFALKLLAEREDVDFRGRLVHHRYAQIKKQRLLRVLKLFQVGGAPGRQRV